MPYSTAERNELVFYKSLVSELRDTHIQRIKESIPKKFRDENNVLQSFEDIISTEGLENVNLEGTLYSNVLFNPNMEGKTQTEKDEIMSYYDGIRNSMLTLQDTKLKKYTKSELLNKTISRNFTELDTTTTSILPIPIPAELDDDGTVVTEIQEVENGDIITVTVSDDMRIWLIQDNKKRRFITKEDFFNSKYVYKQITEARREAIRLGLVEDIKVVNPIKELTLDFVKSIDDGKIIVLESQAPYGEPVEVDRTRAKEPYSGGDIDEYDAP